MSGTTTATVSAHSHLDGRVRDEPGDCKVNPKGEIVTDERETADILNDYFASVFTVEKDRGEEVTPYQMTVAAQLFQVDITEEDVMHII